MPANRHGDGRHDPHSSKNTAVLWGLVTLVFPVGAFLIAHFTISALGVPIPLGIAVGVVFWALASIVLTTDTGAQ